MCSHLIYIIEGLTDDQARLATAQQNKIDELRDTIALERIDDKARLDSVRIVLNTHIREKNETISELQDTLEVAEEELADRESTLSAYRTQNIAQYHTINELRTENRDLVIENGDLATELSDTIQLARSKKADPDTSNSTIRELRKKLANSDKNRWKMVGITEELKDECERNTGIIEDQVTQIRAYKVDYDSRTYDSIMLSKVGEVVTKWQDSTRVHRSTLDWEMMRDIYNIFRENVYKV